MSFHRFYRSISDPAEERTVRLPVSFSSCFLSGYERPDLLLFLTAAGEASSRSTLLFLGRVSPLAFRCLGVLISKDGKSM